MALDLIEQEQFDDEIKQYLKFAVDRFIKSKNDLENVFSNIAAYRDNPDIKTAWIPLLQVRIDQGKNIITNMLGGIS